MKATQKNTNMNRERGFTLLLAALVASIVLALGASIAQIAQKQLTLSSIGRDSQYAFYAADTGAECALYWDSRYQRFPTSTPVSVTLSCDDNSGITTTVSSAGSVVESYFRFEPNGFCVDVYVEKTLVQPYNSIRTAVRANGYSTNCANVETSARVLQRSVELRY